MDTSEEAVDAIDKCKQDVLAELLRRTEDTDTQGPRNGDPAEEETCRA